VAADGGDTELLRLYRALQDLLPQQPNAVVVESMEGDLEATYQRLLGSLA
jgi:hypothetical protein